MLEAIGLVEFSSIARGIEAADAMLKTGRVDIIASRSICPGKYMTLIKGDVAAVESAVKAGKEIGATLVVDDFILPNVHPTVIPAITATSMDTEIHALGVIESFSVAAIIVAADAAVKAGEVDLIEIRLGMGLGGKAFVTMTGDVAAVNTAVKAGSEKALVKGLLVEEVVIPSPHQGLIPSIL